VIETPCVTSDIYPTILEWTGTKAERQPPLDGISLVPLLDGKEKTRTKPIGFWDHPTAGVGTPTKQWMDELLADQKAGREPADPKRLFSDAGTITTKYPIDRFPGHAGWIDGNWKLHRIEAAKGTSVRWELYDLAADPKESREVSATEPKRLESMKKAMTQWLESVTRSLNGDDYSKKP
jgi:arylsulfatase A-like enzyme